MARIVMNIDFDDEIIYRDDPVTVGDIDEMMRRSKEMGADTVTWRVTTLGRADWRSEVMDRSDVPLDEADVDRCDRAGGWFRTPERPKSGPMTREQRLGLRGPQPAKSKAILAAYDPPQVAREMATKHGLELYLWFDPFDEFFPGHGNRFLREHPEYQWVSRDGERRFEGLRCHGYPACIENHMDALSELVAYEPDGMYFATSCHSRHRDRTGEWDGYGFNDPVVDLYRERLGKDIRQDDLDLDAWHRIKGEFVTRFYAAAAGLLKPLGVKVMLPVPIGDHKILDYPLWSLQSVAQYHMDWRAWIDQGLADSLIVGEYQPVFQDGREAFWGAIAERIGMDGATVLTDAPAQVREYAAGRCEVFYWSAWMHTRDGIATRIARMCQAMDRQPMDGMVMHELFSFEKANYFPDLTARGE